MLFCYCKIYRKQLPAKGTEIISVPFNALVRPSLRKNVPSKKRTQQIRLASAICNFLCSQQRSYDDP